MDCMYYSTIYKGIVKYIYIVYTIIEKLVLSILKNIFNLEYVISIKQVIILQS